MHNVLRVFGHMPKYASKFEQALARLGLWNQKFL